MKERIIVWFSCGAASAIAAKEAIRLYGDTHNVEIVCCDTRPSEDADNYRFSAAVETWLGRKIIYIRSEKYTTVDDVFEKERFMSGITGARCTVELKKKPRFAYATPDDIHVFGLTADESDRITEFTQRNPELRLLWLLKDQQITKRDCLNRVSRAGIKLPSMYRRGFDNNNCPGCVKATSAWYWQRVREEFPDVFERRCKQSRELGVRLVRLNGERIFLDELPDRTYKKIARSENLSCGPECGVPMQLDLR